MFHRRRSAGRANDGALANAVWTTADLDLSGFTVADVRAGGIYYTGSNEVALARFPVPAGYTHFQITASDDPARWVPGSRPARYLPP